MDALLQQSALINNFTNDAERKGAIALCKNRFESTYETYTNTTQPTEDLLEKVIDIYLFLDVKPSNKVLHDLICFLLKGKTFSKLDVYMHLPQYDQVVKLLHPEYYVEVDPGRFNQFTASKTIYNLALQKGHVVEDSYKNAYSIWYMQRLQARGVELTESDMRHIIEYSSWECVKLITDFDHFDSSIMSYTHKIPPGDVGELKIIEPIQVGKVNGVDIFSKQKIGIYDIMIMVIEANNIDAFKYLLKRIHVFNEMLEKLTSLNRVEMIRHLGPLSEYYDDNDEAFINSLTEENLRYIKDVSPRTLEELIMDFIKLDFTIGVRFIIDNNSISVEHLICAYLHNRKYLKTFYDILVSSTTPASILGYALSMDDVDIARGIYELNPTNINLAFNGYLVTQKDVIDFCISKGLIITDQHVIKNIETVAYRDENLYLMKKYGMIHYSFIETAIKKNITSVIDYALSVGYPLHPSLVSIAIRENNYDMVSHLVSLGCPVYHGDLINIPSKKHDQLEVRDYTC